MYGSARGAASRSTDTVGKHTVREVGGNFCGVSRDGIIASLS